MCLTQESPDAFHTAHILSGFLYYLPRAYSTCISAICPIPRPLLAAGMDPVAFISVICAHNNYLNMFGLCFHPHPMKNGPKTNLLHFLRCTGKKRGELEQASELDPSPQLLHCAQPCSIK